MSFLIGSTYQSGTGTAAVAIPNGVLNAQSTAVGNVTTGEDDLHTYTMPASTLVATNRIIVWEGSGTFANNANAKTHRVYFGAVMHTLVAPAGLLSVAVEWRGSAKIYRTGSNAQRYEISVRYSVPATGEILEFASQGTLTQTEAGTIIIKSTGDATATNDIVQNTSSVEFR